MVAGRSNEDPSLAEVLDLQGEGDFGQEELPHHFLRHLFDESEQGLLRGWLLEAHVCVVG